MDRMVRGVFAPARRGAAGGAVSSRSPFFVAADRFIIAGLPRCEGEYRGGVAGTIRHGRRAEPVPSRTVIAMPKQKTHKATKKRFRLTASGKAKHRQAGTSHLAARMSKKRRRKLRGTTTANKAELPRIHEALRGNSY